MSDYFEDDYSEPAPNPQTAESDVVAQYFGGGPADDYAEYDLGDVDDFDVSEEPQYSEPGPVEPRLALQGFEQALEQKMSDQLGPYAAGFQALAQNRAEWDARMQAEAQAREQQELAEGYQAVAGIIAQERQAGGLHMASEEDVVNVANEIYHSALAQGYEDGPGLAESAISAACQTLRRQEISRAALEKA